VFCGTAEVTDEHVWPDWINRALLPELKLHKVRTKTDPVSKQTEGVGPSWGGPDLDIKVKRVCGTCNSGWMSDLENEAKPYLTPLILGEAVVLDRRAREIVAAWTFLRVVMAEYTHPRQIAVPEFHRRWLYKERRPPRQGVYIWLAGYSGEDWAAFYRHVPLATHKRPIGSGYRPGHMNAYGVTFAVYKLVFQVFGTTTAMPGGDIQQRGTLGASTLRIWPGRGKDSIVAPVGQPLTDATMDRFANIFTEPPR